MTDDADVTEGEGVREVWADERSTEDPLEILNTYLVVDVADPMVIPADQSVDVRNVGIDGRLQSHVSMRQSPLRSVLGNGVIVAAPDADTAVQIVMAEARRIGTYMIVQVELIDFAVNLRQEQAARGRTLRLNP